LHGASLLAPWNVNLIKDGRMRWEGKITDVS